MMNVVELLPITEQFKIDVITVVVFDREIIPSHWKYLCPNFNPIFLVMIYFLTGIQMVATQEQTCLDNLYKHK